LLRRFEGALLLRGGGEKCRELFLSLAYFHSMRSTDDGIYEGKEKPLSKPPLFDVLFIPSQGT